MRFLNFTRPRQSWHVRLVVVVLLGFMAPVDAADAPGAPARTVVVLGDSLAAGYGLDAKDAYPAVLQKKITAEGLSFKVVNAGLSGDTSAGGLRRLDWVLRRPVDVLVLELGGNDGLRGLPVEAMKQNLQTIITRTKQKYPQAQIVVVGMKMPTNLGGYATRFDEVFGELAKENQAALVPFLLEGVGGREELNQPDLIHPTPAGQKILAENVWKVLRPLLATTAPSKQAAWEAFSPGFSLKPSI